MLLWPVCKYEKTLYYCYRVFVVNFALYHFDIVFLFIWVFTSLDP